MSKPISFFRGVANRPLEAIEALVALSLSLSGIWLVSPLYQPEVSTTQQVTGNPAIPMVLGMVQILLGVPLLYAVLKKDWAFRNRVRRLVTYITFLLYLFYGFSQVILFRLHRVTWIATFSLALVAGVTHIKLKVDKDADGN